MDMKLISPSEMKKVTQMKDNKLFRRNFVPRGVKQAMKKMI